MSLYKRLLTQLVGKMGPALRVFYMDVGEGREQGYGSFAPENAPLGVACRDASQGREQDALSFARCSFGVTTKTSGMFLRVSPAGVRHKDVPSKPRALIGAFSGATVTIELVLTGPN